MTAKMAGVIVYVPDVGEALSFWEKAFGLSRGFVPDGNQYGELDGPVAIAFADETFIDGSLPVEAARNRAGGTPPGFEIMLVVDDVDAAHTRAVESGCTSVVAPVTKPWGQRLAYVREMHGVLVEICTAWK